ncbi:MAG: hypothetical protein IKX06_05200 [Clostridia bacterium]|nr:hypothetical protein [Clostridia bacterium]
MCLLDHEFKGEYELELSAWGEGILREQGLLKMQKPDAILSAFQKKFRRYPKSISLLVEDSRGFGNDNGFTGIETELLEKFETLKELILPETITHLDISPKLGNILRENDTLIRGRFDSFAETFARENGLHFRPADLVFASFTDTRFFESTTMTLLFRRNGKVEIRERSTSPGSNAGNTFGGSFTHPLPGDFWKTGTAEQIAERFYDDARTAIIEDGRLAGFIEKAKTHGYYQGKN